MANDIDMSISNVARFRANTRYEYYFSTSDASNAAEGAAWRGQSFTIGTAGPNVNFILNGVSLYSWRSSSGSDEIKVEIYAVDGGGLPTGSPLSSATVDNTLWSTSAAMHYISMPAYTLQASTKYALVVYTADATGIRWALDASSPTYTGGCLLVSSDSGASWSESTTIDTLFYIWGFPE